MYKRNYQRAGYSAVFFGAVLLFEAICVAGGAEPLVGRNDDRSVRNKR